MDNKELFILSHLQDSKNTIALGWGAYRHYAIEQANAAVNWRVRGCQSKLWAIAFQKRKNTSMKYIINAWHSIYRERKGAWTLDLMIMKLKYLIISIFIHFHIVSWGMVSKLLCNFSFSPFFTPFLPLELGGCKWGANGILCPSEKQ